MGDGWLNLHSISVCSVYKKGAERCFDLWFTSRNLLVGMLIVRKLPVAYEIRSDVESTENSHLAQLMMLEVGVRPARYSVLRWAGVRVQGPAKISIFLITRVCW